MQNYSKMIGALAAASALVAGNANAEVEYQLHTGYSSEYLFRGVNLGKDLVETGVDASTTVGDINLSAGVWYANYQQNLGFEGANGSFNLNEIDLYASASKDLGFATASVGYIYYANSTEDAVASFYGNLPDTQEVSLGLSRDLGFATASLTYFADIVGDNDGYSELALSRSFEVSACLKLNVASNVGYLVEQDQFTAWTTKASLDYGFAEHAKLSPFLAYSVALSDEAGAYNGSENEFVAGSLLSVSF